MVRVSLPFRGVAVVLLCASAAAGQTSLPTADFSGDFLSPFAPEVLRLTSFGQTLETADSPDPFESPTLPVMWRYQTEMPPLLETSANADLPALDNLTALNPAPKDAKDTKPSPRLTPLPSSDGQGAPSACCPPVVEEVFCCTPTILPFACCPPPPPPCCSKHCCKHKKHCCGGGCGQGYGYGYGPGYGGGCGQGCCNPYLAWPCGMQCCPNFCAPPPSCCGHKCHHKHGHCCQNNFCGGYPGYGCASPWGMCGSMCGGLECDCCPSLPCPAFYCNPYPPSCCSKHCCKHKKHCCGGGCDSGYGYGGGYPGYGYDGSYGGYGCGGGYMNPYGCGGGGCCKQHHGLFHRCHSCPPPPPPCPCFCPCPCFAMQSCMGMDMGMDMGMGACPSCSAGSCGP